ncbi:hypothetical protein BROUX41_006227 [Berkeleyomyces rouxiae]|uniref:uncharacterized protein n=1 Tax=Berkeleyomyces rouxiae TaxID=2035830 RepID=UPI003B770CB6
MCRYIQSVSPLSTSPHNFSTHFEPCSHYQYTGIVCPQPFNLPIHFPPVPTPSLAPGAPISSVHYTHQRSNTPNIPSPARTYLAPTINNHQAQNYATVSGDSKRHGRGIDNIQCHPRDYQPINSPLGGSYRLSLASPALNIPRTVADIPSIVFTNMSSKPTANLSHHQPQQTSPSLSESRMRQMNPSALKDKDTQAKKKRGASRPRSRRYSTSSYSSLSEASEDEDDDRHKQSVRHKLRREIARERERMLLKKTAADSSNARSSSKARYEETNTGPDDDERRRRRHNKQQRSYEAPLVFSDNEDEETRRLRINSRIAAHNREINRRPAYPSPNSTPLSSHASTAVGPSSSTTIGPSSKPGAGGHSPNSSSTPKVSKSSKSGSKYVRPGVEIPVDELMLADQMRHLDFGSGPNGNGMPTDARQPRSTRTPAYDETPLWQQQQKFEDDALRERLKGRFVPRFNANQPQAW